jgi:DNA-binding beta-propeller fold protein YncE/mono/diheme cytochrome c family protein
MSRHRIALAVLLGSLLFVAGTTVRFATSTAEAGSEGTAEDPPQAGSDRDLAPVAVAPLGEQQLVVLASEGRRLILLDRDTSERRRTIPLPADGSGMVIRDRTAYVTTAEPAGRLLEVDVDRARIVRSWRVGHMPMAPVLSPNGSLVYLANRFENRVRCVDLATGGQRTVDVVREPVALAMAPDGRRLFAANHLPCVRPFLDDENPSIVAEVSVIDIPQMEVIRTIALPNGSQGLRGIAVSPDGNWVAVTHILSNYTVPTLEIARGKMNRNALSLLRTGTLEPFATVVLDDPEMGAANPWGVCFTADGQQLIVSHAGTNELSVIDFASLLERLATGRGTDRQFDDESLSMMTGIRRRIALPITGPRAICAADGVIYAAGFFSDNLAAVDLRTDSPSVRAIDLGPRLPASPARQGAAYFNDATLCFQQWQSCATCHPDGRADALYWDLLNDGIGNTKNTKSLLMAALTPPVMWRGVRADAGLAVMSGIRHIQFVEPSPDQARAIERYLLEMKAVPSPQLNADVLETAKTDKASCAKCHRPGIARGSLTDAARRGKALFEGPAGCSPCHPHPYFTSMQTVDGGLGTGIAYDVPSLVEAWRSAPYLHHGDALTLEETLTDFNHLQQRGTTRRLDPAELRDLLEYLRSL